MVKHQLKYSAGLTGDQTVTYDLGHGRGFQGACRPDPPRPARPAVRGGRSDADRARAAACDDAIRRHEARGGARGGRARDDAAARAGEAPLPQPRPDPAHPRPLGEQVRRAMGRDAQWAQDTTGGMMEKVKEGGISLAAEDTVAVFEIYIKTTPERLWEAITDPSMRAKYRCGVETKSDWTPGSGYESSVPGVIDIASGKNLEVDPPRRLVQTMTALWSEDVKAAGASKVTWEIEPVGGDSCRLSVIHSE